MVWEAPLMLHSVRASTHRSGRSARYSGSYTYSCQAGDPNTADVVTALPDAVTCVLPGTLIIGATYTF